MVSDRCEHVRESGETDAGCRVSVLCSLVYSHSHASTGA